MWFFFILFSDLCNIMDRTRMDLDSFPSCGKLSFSDCGKKKINQNLDKVYELKVIMTKI